MGQRDLRGAAFGALGGSALIFGFAACDSLAGLSGGTSSDSGSPVDAMLEGAVDGAIQTADTGIRTESGTPLDSGTDAPIPPIGDSAAESNTDAARESGADAAPDTGMSMGCTGSSCTTIAGNLDTPAGIAVDSANVYWTDDSASAGAVMSCPLTGCGNGPTTLVSGLNQPEPLLLDGTSLFWGEVNNTGSAHIATCELPSCSPVGQLYQTATKAIAVDATSLYWADLFNAFLGVVPRSPDAGAGSALAFLPGNPMGLVGDTSNLYFTLASFTPGNNDILELCAKAGCPSPVSLATGTAQTNAQGIAIDDSTIYFAEEGDGNIVSISKMNGAPTVIASGLLSPTAVAIDATTVYFTTQGNGLGGTVAKVPKAGGNVTVIASAQRNPFALAVDATNVYWTSHSNPGAVLTAPK